MQRVSVYHEHGKPIYSGFIYIWRNSVTGKFYIGSHMGHTSDGYIGSGKHFRHAYKNSPQTFRRKIVEYVCGDVNHLIEREEHWLVLAERKQASHYNSIFFARGLHKHSYDSKKVMGFLKTGRKWYNDGVRDYMLHDSDERVSTLQSGRIEVSRNKKGVNSNTIWIHDGECERKIDCSMSIPDGWERGRSPNARKSIKTKTVSNETKYKIAQANTGLKKSAELKQKMRESKLGRKWYTNGEVTVLAKEHPGDGWVIGRKK